MSRSDAASALLPEISDSISGLDKAKTELESVSNNPKYEWVDHATMEGQLLSADQWKKGDTKVLLLDLSKSEDLEKYSSLVNASSVEDPALIILDENKQFCNSSENWKILLTITNILYKRVIPKDNERKD
jgi:hypothetical protein